MTRCPKCGASTTVVATVVGGRDPHTTYRCNAWKRCGWYFRKPIGGAS